MAKSKSSVARALVYNKQQYWIYFSIQWNKNGGLNCSNGLKLAADSDLT